MTLKVCVLLYTTIMKKFMDEIKKHIDVIIPCYNVEETIEECIKSLCNQSLSKNEYNCYFINDCSKDSTGSILDKYKSIENINVFHHKKSRFSHD